MAVCSLRAGIKALEESSGTRSGFAGEISGESNVGQSIDSEETRDPMDSMIVAWRNDPRDQRPLAGVRAEFLARYATAIQSGVGDAGELLRAASNLMDRIGEGTVEPNEAVVAALGDAAGRMGDPTHAMDSGVDELVERLDAYASGLPDSELGDALPSTRAVPAEPPLLTVRHDGARIKPGSFEATSSPGDVLPSELTVLVDAWEAVGDHLRGQLESVRSIADPNAESELRGVSIALEGVVGTIERLNGILAAYARRVDG